MQNMWISSNKIIIGDHPVEVNKVSKSFGGSAAVKEVDLHVGEGEIVGLVGPNGAGKSTLLNLISGLYRPNNGSIIFNGIDVTKMPSYKICNLAITKTFQLIHSFPDHRIAPQLPNIVLNYIFLCRSFMLVVHIHYKIFALVEKVILGRCLSLFDKKIRWYFKKLQD